jgi:hypothetical protein
MLIGWCMGGLIRHNRHKSRGREWPQVGVLALIPVIALFVMRVSRADLSGAGPAPEPAGDATSPDLA